jgi:hypothetical protein
VRFSSVPPSTPLFSFSVLEWTPANGLLAHLYPKRATSLQRLENNASMMSTEEERRDPRDRLVFESAAGTWSCFRQISCCGDVLVLEDAETVDIGPPRRHEYTWQQGPGRLPSVENGSMSFGANGGWRQTLASVSQGVTELDGDAATHAQRIARPSHHHREVPLQDIHSIRRHVFKRPLPLTFNWTGHLVDAAAEEQRGGRSKSVRSSRRGSGSVDDLDSLEWRYELWGPVGVVFMLRGGARLFLVFASGHDAEQMEELLVDFASGRGLQRRQRQTSLVNTAATGASFSVHAAATTSESVGDYGGVVSSPALPGLPGSPALSYASLRLVSPEASFPGNPNSLYQSPGASLALAEVGAPTQSLSSVAAVLTSGASVASTGSPSFSPQLRPLLSVAGPVANSSVAAPPPLMSSVNTAPVSSTSASSRASGALSLSSPGAGYLYCRPWGEAERHRRYYLRPASASPTSKNLVRLSRHRLPAWQKIRQTLGQEPRAIAVDLRQTYLTPSSTHQNVFRVESVVDTYAQYKDVVPLGGAVATAGPGDEAPSIMATRRREMELCRSRPIVFEALAKTKEERAEWLAWLQARGATVLHPEATNAPHMVGTAEVKHIAAAKPARGAAFQPLGHQLIPSASPCNASTRELSRANSVDRWMTNCGLPSLSTDASPNVEPLGETRQQPQLPLKESDSERGSTSASVSLRVRWPANSPMRYPQPRPHAMRFFTPSPGSMSKLSNSSSSPDPVATVAAPPRARQSPSSPDVQPCQRSDDANENSGVVGNEPGRSASQLVGTQLSLRPPSPKSPLPGGPEVLDHTFKPSRQAGNAAETKPQGSSLSMGDVTAAAAMQLFARHDGQRGAANGTNDRVAAVIAHAPVAVNLSGEEGLTTDHTLTGMGPTVGAPCTPVYLDDTSSEDADHCNSPPFSSPSPSNTVPANSPHSKTPSLRSPSVLQQRDKNTDKAEGRREATNWHRSMSLSPPSTAADKDGKTTFDEAEARPRLPSGTAAGWRVRTEDRKECSNAGLASADLSGMRRSTTEIPRLCVGSDMAVYYSATGVTGLTPSQETVSASSLAPVSVTSVVKTARSSATPFLHSRSATATPGAAPENGADWGDSLHSTPTKRLIQELPTSVGASASASPNAPGGAAATHALRAKLPGATATSDEASPVGRALFIPTEHEDCGVPTQDAGVGRVAAATCISAMMPPPSVLDTVSLNGSLRAYPVTRTANDETGEWSGVKVSRTSPVRGLDPRLTQFFTPAQVSESELERSGERSTPNVLGPRAASVPSCNQPTLRSSNHSTNSRACPSAVERSLRDTPLPPPLPPRVGSLTSTGCHNISADGSLRGRASFTVDGEKNGSEGGGSPVLNSASSRTTYRDSEHLSNSFPFQSRAVMEQRKRAFRDSLFVNHD